MKTWINGKIVDLSAEEIAKIEAERKEWNDALPTRQLEQIRKIRNRKLTETDYLATSDNTMSDEMKAFRKSMRDIPQDYSADKYDELLDRNDKGELTHSVWSKP